MYESPSVDAQTVTSYVPVPLAGFHCNGESNRFAVWQQRNNRELSFRLLACTGFGTVWAFCGSADFRRTNAAYKHMACRDAWSAPLSLLYVCVPLLTLRFCSQFLANHVQCNGEATSLQSNTDQRSFTQAHTLQAGTGALRLRLALGWQTHTLGPSVQALWLVLAAPLTCFEPLLLYAHHMHFMHITCMHDHFQHVITPTLSSALGASS